MVVHTYILIESFGRGSRSQGNVPGRTLPVMVQDLNQVPPLQSLFELPLLCYPSKLITIIFSNAGCNHENLPPPLGGGVLLESVSAQAWPSPRSH